MSNLICEEELPAYGVDPCAPLLQADSDAMAVIKQFQTDISTYSNASEWANAITNNSVSIMKNIKVSVPEPSAKTLTNPRVQGPPNIHTGFDYVINFEDATISDANTAFYAALNGQTRNVAWRLYEETQCLLALYPFYFIVTPVYGEFGAVLMYKGTATAKLGPNDTIDLFDTPAGIFD